MASLWLDLRYAFRGLRKAPAFSFLAVLSLALGIGAVTTIFSVIQNALLNPFPYRDSGRLMNVSIHDMTRSGHGGRSFFSTAEYLDYAASNHIFDQVIGVTRKDVLYRHNGGTEQFDGAMTTANSFQFLGVPPLLGRGLALDDAKPGAPPVFVMSYKMWNKVFDRDPKILGRTFALNNTPRTLVGIMPPRFTWFAGDLWMPVTLSRSDPAAKKGFYFLLGHLRPGVTEEQAEADLEVIAKRLAPLYPDQYPKQFNIQIQPLAETVVGQFRTTLFILMAAVGMLLSIACVNVANLLLAKATSREKEIAIRASLGGSRGRLIRQLLVESLVLALGGAVLGCLFAYAGIQVLVPLIPEQTIPAEAVIRLNTEVLIFTLMIAIVTALIFGLAPALHVTKDRLAESLKDTGKGLSGGYRHGNLRSVLVVAETALSLVLLVGAGLLMRSFFALQQVDLGFNPKNILVARTPLPADRYKTIEQKQRFFNEVLQRLHSIPGIVAATETSDLPPYGGDNGEIDIPGKIHTDKWQAFIRLVSDRFNDTVGLRLQKGRFLSEAEVNDRRRVVIVNQTLVTKYFGTEDPIGRQLQIPWLKTVPDAVGDPTFEVIGVISDAKNQGLQEKPVPELFIPYTLTAFGERGVLVRTAGDPLRMLETVRKQIWAVDSNVALTMTDSLEGFLRRFSYSGPRFGLILLGIFAGVGLVLVGIGVYSVISYTVARQTHEIGIRIALGAGTENVLRMVFWMGLRLVGAGILTGLVASAAASRLIASQIWGVSPYDPLTLVTVILVLVAVGCASCYFPARRAVQVEPIIALRYE